MSVKAVELDNKMNGRAVQIRVTQGKEPRHFMAIFGGRLIIYSGGHASAFEAKQGEVDEELGKSYMLEVRDSGARGTKAIQVCIYIYMHTHTHTPIIYTYIHIYIFISNYPSLTYL